MKTHIVGLVISILLILCSICVAGCLESTNSEISPEDSEYIGTWTVTGTFLADGELCNAAYTFRSDGTGIRELISPATGDTLSVENLTWERTGTFDNVKISYEDGYEEIASLGWLKGTW